MGVCVGGWVRKVESKRSGRELEKKEPAVRKMKPYLTSYTEDVSVLLPVGTSVHRYKYAIVTPVIQMCVVYNRWSELRLRHSIPAYRAQRTTSLTFKMVAQCFWIQCSGTDNRSMFLLPPSTLSDRPQFCLEGTKRWTGCGSMRTRIEKQCSRFLERRKTSSTDIQNEPDVNVSLQQYNNEIQIYLPDRYHKCDSFGPITLPFLVALN